jgi:hypothetical protein
MVDIERVRCGFGKFGQKKKPPARADRAGGMEVLEGEKRGEEKILKRGST